ncbi:MAG: DUF3795 domain-containing protein [Spirochaetes bacterium]|nr:DUF3795 domain-containing protein [Spirochaetota bacterium]
MSMIIPTYEPSKNGDEYFNSDIKRTLPPAGSSTGPVLLSIEHASAARPKTENTKKSNWNCRIRLCCYDIVKKSFCIECGKFPCRTIKRKLLDTHPEDQKYNYR